MGMLTWYEEDNWMFLSDLNKLKNVGECKNGSIKRNTKRNKETRIKEK
jgi:hypothetical protein